MSQPEIYGLSKKSLHQETNVGDSASSQGHTLPKLMVWALGLSRPYRMSILLILLVMIVETAAGLATPMPLKIIIDNVVGNHALPRGLGWMRSLIIGESKLQLAGLAAILFVTIQMIGSGAGYVENYFNESVAQRVANDLRRKMYHHLQRLSLAYYDTHQTGKLLSTLTSDVSTIQDFASSTLMSMLVDALTIVGMLGIMFYLNAGFTLVALAVTPFLLFFVARFRKAMKKASREVRQDQSNMFIVLQEGLESIRVVNAFGRQDFEEERLRKVSKETFNAALHARKIKSALNPMVTIVVSVCTALVLWRGAGLVSTGVMTVGSLTVFVWYMNKFFSPVQDLAKMTNAVAQASVALERIRMILDTETTVVEKLNAVDPGKLLGDISFDGVSFSYNPGSPVLSNLHLNIQKGQHVGICGPTGCGKSTIGSLIARFYDPTSGRILIDGMDISDFELDALHNQIAFVLQDTVLFYGSVRDNIAYGRPGATEVEIIRAAALANASEFIQKMPHGFDTLIGEKGVTLSGGQKQRIGIARAIVRDSPILILDEPTAALDTESEKLVMEALANLTAGRTVITIAHRLSTIQDADQIIVLENGSIAEQGTHEELIQRDGCYADLYHAQNWDNHKLNKTS